jgi:MFS family permease
MYRNLSKSIWALTIINFINGAGSFVFPFLTLFLTLKLGYTITQAGFFTMLSIGMYAPGSIISSRLADKFSRKRIMIITQTLCAISMIACGLSMNNKTLVPYLILLIFLFDGATDPARAAIHADHTSFNNRKEAYSLFYLAYNIGFAIGPIVAGLLFNKYPQWLFIGNGIVSLIGILFVMILIEDRIPTDLDFEKSIKYNSPDKAVQGSVWKAVKERPLLISYLLITSFDGIARAFVFFALPLLFNQIFKISGPTLYGSVMSINAITIIIGTPIVIKISNKNHPLRDIAIANILYSISFFLLGFTTIYIFLAALVALFSIGEAISASNHSYFVTNQTPIGHRARFSSIRTILEGAGFAIGPLLGGKIIDKYGYPTIFIISSIILAICFVGLEILRLLYKQKQGTKY